MRLFGFVVGPRALCKSAFAARTLLIGWRLSAALFHLRLPSHVESHRRKGGVTDRSAGGGTPWPRNPTVPKRRKADT